LQLGLIEVLLEIIRWWLGIFPFKTRKCPCNMVLPEIHWESTVALSKLLPVGALYDASAAVCAAKISLRI